MARGKVARRAVVSEIAHILDSPEVAALIRDLEPRGKGRKGYGPRALVGACLVKSFYSLATWTLVAAIIAEHPGLQRVLGGSPSVWACYRFATKLREQSEALADCLDAISASLQREFPEYGADAAIDGSDLAAFANGQRWTGKNEDGVKSRPERKHFSDPDASWGHRSAVSTRGAGSFYGYKLHMAACTHTGLPLAWCVETARMHESNVAAPLLDAMYERGILPATCAMDKGYDNSRVYADCGNRGVIPIIPLRKLKDSGTLRNFPVIPRDTDRWRDLYRTRVAVERTFADLKLHYGLAPLRVRGIERVRLHANLVMLARLAQALSRVREAVAIAA